MIIHLINAVLIPPDEPVKIDENIIGQPSQEVNSKSLAEKVVFLPGTAGKKVTLICIAFKRSSQSIIDSCIQPFEREFEKDSKFAVYEIPMINSS